MRNILFVSHANPEDNEFAQWISLQLAKHGYAVWCDLTQLLGGEDFWNDIESALRERTVKFLYVLSTTSNKKQGALNELMLANNVMKKENLHDFIIPLRIDNIDHRDINIELARLNAIPFKQGWAKGLQQLLEKLEKDEIEKNENFSPEAVSTWWKKQFSAETGIVSNPEEYLSNWFQIESLPNKINFHVFETKAEKNLQGLWELPFPVFRNKQYLVSFASAADIRKGTDSLVSINYTHTTLTDDFLSGEGKPQIVDTQDARKFVARLLNIGWGQMVRRLNIPTYEMANKVWCSYFSKGLVENDKIFFAGVHDKQTWRQVCGKVKNKYWHWGIHARAILLPINAYSIWPHVLFSDNGSEVWESTRRMHRARRSMCKNWWNPEWRDRILATMLWLSNDDGKIEIKLGEEISIFVSNFPVSFKSPTTYCEPEKEPTEFRDNSDNLHEFDYASIGDEQDV